MRFLFKYLLVGMACSIAWLNSFGQCPTYAMLGKQLFAINTSTTFSAEAKLQALYALKKDAEKCHITSDSTYALLLRSIGNTEYVARNNYNLAVAFTSKAVSLNNALKTNGSRHLSAVCYYSIGYYHQNAKLYRQALAYYDSAVACSVSAADIKMLRLPAKQNQAYLCFFLGDYEKSVEECVLGMKDATLMKDSARYLILLNIKAQSLCFENSLQEAAADATSAIQLAMILKDSFELASAYKTSGFIAEKNNQYPLSEDFYTKAITIRKRTGDVAATASDYIDLGNFYLNSLHRYADAKQSYCNALSYARQISDSLLAASQLALVFANLGDNSYENNKLPEAMQYFTNAFRYLNVPLSDYLLTNPPAVQLSRVEHKELVYNLLAQKIALLLQLYQQQKDTKYLAACLQTALLTDTVITHTRYELSNEASKLFWRNNTRQFFANAMEACYLSGNPKLAFYFMEKSRAVLLSDKLKELGATAHLPAGQARQEEVLQTKIVEAEQRLAQLIPSSKEYAQAEFDYLNEKQNLQHFIQSLEKNYPAYYQYKYADDVPALASLQQYLAKNRECFVHFFMNDSVMYILGITPNYTTFKKLTPKDFNSQQLVTFLNLCSSKEQLNNSYGVFAALAQNIYHQLFEPLHLPYGNVAICTDNFLIPFEALCTDANGRDFLLYQYNFSYVYSAQTLMQPFTSHVAAAGNFIGFAPVNFAQNLRLVPLQQSADALSQSAEFYSHPAVFTHTKATRSNFILHAADYAVITVFSHAKADTSGAEPVLYLQDSSIHLSELQLLPKKSAQFVLLSACQTNIGKAATGEGIYSLARGFAAAGIPSIAATLWKADDQTIYLISSKFNEYLAAGMPKGEALQKAKLWFIKNSDNSEHQLPYYWANMVLIGNTQPIVLMKESSIGKWITIFAVLFIVVIAAVIVIRRKMGMHSRQRIAGEQLKESLIPRY